MGLGKRYTALDAVLHIKWLSKQAANDEPIMDHRMRLAEMPFKCQLRVEHLDILHRPVLVVVPLALITI